MLLKKLQKKLGTRILAVALCASVLSGSFAVLGQNTGSVLAAQETGLDVWTATSNENIFREDVKQEDSTAKINVYCARNEFESAQILLRNAGAFKINGVSFSDLTNGADTITADNLKYNFVEYEYLTNNTSGQNRNTTVKWGAGYYPDALSNETAMEVAADSTQPIWVRLYVPKETPAGIYSGTATVATDKGDISVPIEAKVYDVTIPDSKDAEFSFSFWSNLAATWDLEDEYDGISVLYGYEKYSHEWWALMDNIAQLMKDNRSNDLMINIPALLKDGGTYIDENGDYVFNWNRFDEYIQFFMDRGVVKRLEGYAILMCVYASNYNVAILQENGDQPLKKATVAFDTEEGQKWLQQMIPALCAHLEEKGWDEMWFQHVGDEPFNIPAQISKWSAVQDMIHACNPNIKCGDPIDNSGCTSAMINMDADIHFPVLSVHEQELATYDSLREQGKEVFMYTCLNPQGNYLNRFVDKPVWQMKTIGWLSYKRDVSGHLHWGFNEWLNYGKKTFNSIARQNYKGDNFTIYPDVDITENASGEIETSVPRRAEVKSSIRYEAVRDACEDYEIFKILEQRDRALAKEIAGSIVTDGVNYSWNLELMAKQRQRLLDEAALEQVSASFTQEEGKDFYQVKVSFEGLTAGHTLYYNSSVKEADTTLNSFLIGQDKPALYNTVLVSGQSLDWKNNEYLNVVEVDEQNHVVTYVTIAITKAKMPMASTIPLTVPVTIEATENERIVKLTFDTVAGENIVVNPDFEKGTEGWTDSNNFIVADTEGLEGGKAAQVGTGEGGCTQDVVLLPGATYELKASGKVSKAGEKGWVSVYVNSEQYTLEFTETEYTEKSLTLTVPAGENSSRVLTWKNDSRYGGLDDAYFYADNISIRRMDSGIEDGHAYFYSNEKNQAEDVKTGVVKPVIYGTALGNNTELSRLPGEYVNIIEVDKNGKVVALVSMQVPYQKLTAEDLKKLLADNASYLSKQTEYQEKGWDVFVEQYKAVENVIADSNAGLMDYNAAKFAFLDAVDQLKVKENKEVIAFMEEVREGGKYWKDNYGKEGYVLFAHNSDYSDVTNLPDYMDAFQVNGSMWHDEDNAQYALIAPDGSMPGHVGMYFGNYTVDITVDVKEDKTEPYYITLYLTDSDATGRSQSISIRQGKKTICTSPEYIRNFQSGVYQTFRVQGDVTVRVSTVNAKNCVVQGIFFDKAKPMTSVALTAPVQSFDRGQPQILENALTDAEGLTVSRLMNGEDELVEGQDYTVTESGLRLMPAYLSSLTDGTHRIDVILSDESSVAWLVQVSGKLVNKTLLQMTYDRVKGLSTEGVIESAVKYFNESLSKARAVLEDADATQEDVNAAWNQLLDATWSLGIYKGEKGALKALIDQAAAMNQDEYEADNWGMLEEALENANTVYADEDATQDVVDEAKEALQKAIDAQVKKQPVNKEILKSLIDRANEMLPNEAKYVATNWPELKEKLAEGQKVYDNEKATQEEVDKAAEALLGAIVAQRFKADKSNLEELLKKAEAIDTTLYTAETVQVFRAALANAKAVMADASLSESDQQIVDAAVKALADAKDGLKLADNGNAGSTDKDDADKGSSDNSSSGSQNGGTNAPKTGDSTPVALWVSLAGMAFFMAALLAGKKRKNNQ